MVNTNCGLLCCSFVASVLSWLINPIVLGSVILFVGFWLLITRGQLKRYYTESGKLKEEFDKYRREMQVKVMMDTCCVSKAGGFVLTRADLLLLGNAWCGSESTVILSFNSTVMQQCKVSYMAEFCGTNLCAWATLISMSLHKAYSMRLGEQQGSKLLGYVS